MSQHDTMNQTRGVAMQRVRDTSKPKEDLLERILARENMLLLGHDI